MMNFIIELKATLHQLANGEPSGPLGYVIVLVAFSLLAWGAGELAGAAARLYGQMRYQDAEKRRKYLEGDE